MALPLPNTTAVQITRLTKALYNAAPGNTYMTAFTASAGTTTAEMTTFANWFAATVSTSAATLASTVVTNIGLTGDAATAGTAYLTAAFAADPSNLGKVILDAMNALSTLSSDATYGTAASTFNDSVATAYAYSINTDNTSTNIVTLQAADEPVAAGTGQTFTLTTGVDQGTAFTGTSGNDTFVGTYDGAATGTFGVSDVLDGGTGTDTLSITASDDAIATLSAAQVTGIETINVRNVDGNATAEVLTVNASNFIGATAINADRSSDSVTISNLASGASAGMVGNGTLANGAFIAGYVAAATAATMNISGGTTAGAVTMTGAGLTSTTINSTGAANTIGALGIAASSTSVVINAATDLTTGAVTAAGATSLTVSGAATTVDLSAAAVTAAITTIDASGLTAGGVKVGALDAAITSFKGGQGNDQVTTAALTTTTAGVIDAGAGTGDRLVVAAGADVDTAAEAALYTGFEIVRNSGTTDLDISLLSGVTSIELNHADAGATKMNATQAAAVTALLTNATNTLSLATATGTSDVLGLTLKNSTAATAVDFTAATVTGFETLNVVSSCGSQAGGSGVGNDLAFAAAANTTAINVSGAYDLTIAAANLTAATAITSTQTGTAALYVSGNLVTGSSVTGSGGADAFILGTGFGTYTGGAGNDTMSGTQAQINTGANYNVVDGGAGTDTLNLTGGGAITIVDNTLSKISGFEKIVIATTVANNQSITTGGWFDAAFKTNGVNLTTTSTLGTVTIDMTSFTGAATIKATTVGTAAAEGRVNIQTGSGADSVTVIIDTATTTNVVSTFGGNDTIIGSLSDETITGGTGVDTMTGGGDADTFAFAAGDSGLPTITNFDTITDFSVGNTDFISFASVSIGTQVGTAGSGVATVGGTGITTFNAADTTFALHLVAAEAALHTTAGSPTAGAALIWQEGLNSMVFISDATAGIGANDVLIQLTGVTAGAFTDGGNTLTVA